MEAKDRIIDAVCRCCNVSRNELYSKKTDYKRCGFARHLCWYILHYDLSMYARTIAEEFGRTDNAVKKGISKIKFLIKHISSYQDLYRDILQNL